MNPNENQNQDPNQAPDQPQQPDYQPQPQPEPAPAPAPEQSSYQSAASQQPAEQQYTQQPAPQPYQPQPEMTPVAAYPPVAGAAAANPAANNATDENQDKSYLVALTLSWLFGSLGGDRFYLGKIGTGVAKLLTFGGLGIWTIIDLLLIAFGKLTAKNDSRKLEGFAKNFHWVKILTIVIVVLNVITGIFITVLVVLAIIGSVNDAKRLQQYETTTPTSSQSQIYSN